MFQSTTTISSASTQPYQWAHTSAITPFPNTFLSSETNLDTLAQLRARSHPVLIAPVPAHRNTKIPNNRSSHHQFDSRDNKGDGCPTIVPSQLLSVHDPWRHATFLFTAFQNKQAWHDQVPSQNCWEVDLWPNSEKFCKSIRSVQNWYVGDPDLRNARVASGNLPPVEQICSSGSSTMGSKRKFSQTLFKIL